jgi:phage-related protein
MQVGEVEAKITATIDGLKNGITQAKEIFSVGINSMKDKSVEMKQSMQNIDNAVDKTANNLKDKDGTAGLITSVKKGAVEAGQSITENIDNTIKKTENTIKNGEFRSGLFSNIKSSATESGRSVENNVYNPIKKVVEFIKNTDGKKGFFSSLKDGAVEAGSALEKNLTSMRDKIFNFKNLMATVIAGAGTKKLFDFTIGNAAQFEQYETAFTVMLGSADKAKSKLKELSDYAATTPFELPEVVDASRLMMAFGLDTKKYLADVGNLASGTGKPIQQVADAFSRLKSGQFGEAFQQLAQLGISRDMLMGKGLEFDKGGSYKGSVDKALTAVQAIVKEKFNGMTEKQGQTMNGLISTFKDNIGAFGREIGEKAFPKAKEALQSLMSKMDEWSKNGTLDRIANATGNIISKVATGIIKLVDGIDKVGSFVSKNWNIIQPILVALGTTIASLMIASKIGKTVDELKKLKEAESIFKTIFGFGPQGLIFIAIIVAIAVAATLIIKNWDKLKPFFQELWNSITSIVQAAWNFIEPTIMGAVNRIKAFWEAVWPRIKEIFEFAWKLMADTLAPILTLIGILIEGAIGFIQGIWSNAWNIIKSTFKLVWDLIVDILKYNFDVITGVFKIALDILTGHWGDAWKHIKELCSNIWNDIKAIFGDLGTNAFNWGKNLIKGFVDGIESMIGRVKGSASKVTEAVKGFLGFNSPSKEGEGRFITVWGTNMIKGFMDGIVKQTPGLHNLLNSVIPNLNENMLPNGLNNTINYDFNSTLSKLLKIIIPLNVDGTELARVEWPNMSEEMALRNQLASVSKGGDN